MRKHTIVCYHSEDQDGLWSGYVAAKAAKNSIVSYFPYNYGEPLEELYKNIDACIDHDEFIPDVILTDISLPRDDMERLLDLPINLIWIDHHQTAIDEMEGLEIAGLRFSDDDPFKAKSATELAWEYFNPDYSIPPLLHYIGRYDVWDKRDERSEEINYALGSYALDLTRSIEQFDMVLQESIFTHVAVGRQIFNYVKVFLAKKARYAYRRHINNHNLLVLNTADKGSICFHSILTPEDDGMVVWRFNGTYYDYSVYSNPDSKNPIHAGQFAKSHGGGGHKGAAGFRTRARLLLF